MSDPVLEAIRDVIQEDVGNRGLRTDPETNLITACLNDFQAACRSLAETPNAAVAIVTGFLIPHAEPPSGETDGPLGALFLARALAPLGMKVALVTDSFCQQALQVGLAACGLQETVPLLSLPLHARPWEVFIERDWQKAFPSGFPLTHLIALERVGPSHAHDRCYTMAGRDITASMAPAHLLFEAASQQNPRITTIGIGDGGNEIGMGKISRDIIQRNIRNGQLIACRVPADHLIVCGVSNWGAYGLAAGVRWLRGRKLDAELFDPERECELLQIMVEQGPLVDGVTGMPTVSVDGLSFERYVEPLRRLQTLG
jgi:hypothetical protein